MPGYLEGLFHLFVLLGPPGLVFALFICPPEENTKGHRQAFARWMIMSMVCLALSSLYLWERGERIYLEAELAQTSAQLESQSELVVARTPDVVHEPGHPCHVGDWRELANRASAECLSAQHAETTGKLYALNMR